ncbi:MAG: OmpH family outer membrane protein [Candidatus Binatia bacterium]
MRRVMLAAMVLLALASAARAQELRIGTVDLQRALNESEAGKKAKERFKVEVDKLQADLAKQKAEIEKIKEDVEKKGLVLKEEERREVEKDYQRRLRDFQRTYKDAQADLQQKDNELTAEILRELAEVILEFGAKSSYTLILEASNTGAVLYNNKTVDITEQVIEAYNAKKKGGKS